MIRLIKLYRDILEELKLRGGRKRKMLEDKRVADRGHNNK